jgi:hypothetical protein
MPTPVLQDAKTLSEELNRPIPAPSQFSEPLMKPREWEFLASNRSAVAESGADPFSRRYPSQSHQ